MNICSLAEVGDRLEEAVTLLPGEPAGPADLFARYEQVAIAILDSEHSNFQPLLLQKYLETKLYIIKLELNLLPLVDPQEE